MDVTRIELANGQILSSGDCTDAVMWMRLTRAVNSTQELSLGSVCSAVVEMELMTQGQSPIRQADTFTLYAGQEKLGVFTAEKPQWNSAHRVKITAYDAVAKLDQDLSAWLQELDPWPNTLRELAEAVCQSCGVALTQENFPNEDFPVRPFKGRNVTGRHILSWIAQAAGRFCCANENGLLTFGWYAPAENGMISPSGIGLTARLEGENLILEGTHTTAGGADLVLPGEAILSGENLTLLGQPGSFYYQGSLELADYRVAPIEKVQIRQDSLDVGMVYPDIGQANTYCITGNPLLTANTKDALQLVLQSLYDQLKSVSYTPCTLSVPVETGLKPGDIVTVTDRMGRQATVYIMESVRQGNRLTLKATGSASRDSVSAANDCSYEALSGKVLRLQTDVEGLRAENADMAGASAALSLTVEGLESKVTAQTADTEALKTQLTALSQDSSSLQLQVQTIKEQGVSQVVTSTGYRFCEDGLQISRTGMEMENVLDHTGMYVKRNGQVILRANNLGVEARDVSVGNYLIVGNHARLEDYGSGTACFYI